MAKKQTNVRLTEEAIDLQEQIAESRGMTKTAVVEQLIREEAKRLGLKPHKHSK